MIITSLKGIPTGYEIISHTIAYTDLTPWRIGMRGGESSAGEVFFRVPVVETRDQPDATAGVTARVPITT
eukprot:CCRYP_002945-RD/>CCRYP_002945-RD protein AED:0.48 eAED:0.66 QI:0/0/0/1/0/0/2/0/69